MSTTSLFVELIVIGSGVVLWLALAIAATFGIDTSGLGQSTVLASALPVLSLTYVLGIVWDRFADWVFTRLWGDGMREAQFGDIGDYYDSRRLILTNSPQLSELLEYGRSRLRICRGWALNAPMVMLSAEYFLLQRFAQSEDRFLLAVLVAAAGVLLTLGCFFAWRSLVRAEYRKVREQAGYLRQREAD